MKIVLGFVALLAIGYGAACTYLWINQRELIFYPSRDLARTPADVAIPYQDVWLPVGTDPGAPLHGWWLQSQAAGAPVWLYLHGNDLNLSGNLEHIARLHRMGFSVLAVDYRGYGMSGGAFPSEVQVYEDADAAWNHLVAQRHVDPERLFIYGHSLGSAVAIELAARHPEAAGLIVESAFTSMPDIAKAVYWMFPVDLLLNQRFDSLAKVPALGPPVLFIHGLADREVPHAMSETLFAAAKGKAKQLTLIPGGGHEDSAIVAEALYTRAVLDFVKNSTHDR